MTTNELIKCLIADHNDLVNELIAEQLQWHIEAEEKNLQDIRVGNRPNCFSLDPFEDYILILDRLDALKKAHEYFA